MSNPQFPDDYGMTVERLEANYEGRRFPAYYPDRDNFECDFCSVGVAYAKTPRVGHYLADGMLHDQTPEAREINQTRALGDFATYCPECSHKRLFFPCKGFTEVRMFFSIDPETREMFDAEVTDISPRDDGIPWNPRELSEKITTIPFDQHVRMADEDLLWAPENMVTFFLSIQSGIDIRELVQWDGSLDDQLLGQARRKFRNHAESRDRPENRKEFRDRLRGE